VLERPGVLRVALIAGMPVKTVNLRLVFGRATEPMHFDNKDRKPGARIFFRLSRRPNGPLGELLHDVPRYVSGLLSVMFPCTRLDPVVEIVARRVIY
jgi:hypothetical protein